MSTRWGVADVVRTHGRGRPDAPAITYGDRVIGWDLLDERSNRVASALVALGAAEGDRIAFIGKNAPEYSGVVLAS
jgi:long-chain acyl-CoA synthetase